MATLTYCYTAQAILLLAIPVPEGYFLFPSSKPLRPGLHFYPKPLMAIHDQLRAQAEQELQMPLGSKELAINHDFCEIFYDPASEAKFSLYIAELLQAFPLKPQSHWQKLPLLLQGMAKDRLRLPYLKAWQVLTGALKLTTKAVEIDDLSPSLKS